MVGENQELCKSTLSLDRTPDSLPSFLNDHLFRIIEESTKAFDSPTPFGSGSTFRYRTMAFSGGSDHAEFTNSTAAVPCVMLLQWPDLYYHTSMDTIDKVSEDSLKRVGWITTVAALTLANATEQEAYVFAHETASKGTARLTEAGTQTLQELHGKAEDAKLRKKPADLAKGLANTAQHGRDKLEHIVWREQQAIRSVKRLADTPELDELIGRLCREIANTGRRETAKLEEALTFIAKTRDVKLAKPEESKTEKELQKLVPERLFKGTLSTDCLKELLSEKDYEWYEKIGEKDRDFGKKMAEIINFMNGKRTAHTIAKAVSAEYSTTNPEHVVKFLKDLQRAKLVALK
jgi:hypothetical protein